MLEHRNLYLLGSWLGILYCAVPRIWILQPSPVVSSHLNGLTILFGMYYEVLEFCKFCLFANAHLDGAFNGLRVANPY